MTFTIAIIGRPNVGKSTLFNRLVGRKLAIVDNTPGVTRDRRIHAARLRDLYFDVIDTAGLDEVRGISLKGHMRAQTRLAIEESNLILFIIDARVAIASVDLILASFVRKSGRPVVLVANKSESRKKNIGLHEARQLGLGDPCAISAEHGNGLDDLRDALIKAGYKEAFEREGQEENQQINMGFLENDIDDAKAEESSYYAGTTLRIAVVGRPNVGKSTLVNTLLGQERFLAGPEAGITRDSIAVDWVWHKRKVKLYDTAGLRRKSQVQDRLERLSVADTLRAIRFSEVVIVVFDATVPFEKQSLQITDLVIREGRALIIVFNKWDLVKGSQGILTRFYEKCERLFPQIRGVRMLPVSGKDGQGIEHLMENVEIVHRVWNQRIATSKLNCWLKRMIAQHPPPAVMGRYLKLKYITQIKIRPPGFIISCSRPDMISASYLRYLVNSLRKDFNIPGVPIRLVIRKPNNPFENKTAKR